MFQRQKICRFGLIKTIRFSSSSHHPVVPESPRLIKIKRKRGADPFESPPPPESFPLEAFSPREYFHFEVIKESSKSNARVGRIHTPHGVVETPGFVPVATNGMLKAVDHRQADAANCSLMFSNTYHLLLQPGPDIVGKAGGIHKFVNRDRPIITDSGGFQVFSLAHGSVHDEINVKSNRRRAQAARSGAKEEKSLLLRVSEEGVIFRSYRDGSKVELTPESTVAAQKCIGADIIIPLDELLPYHVSEKRMLESVFMTHRWEARSLRSHLEGVEGFGYSTKNSPDPKISPSSQLGQAMYGVVHGGMDHSLRKMSVEYISSLPFDGICIGGSVGKDRNDCVEILKYIMPLIRGEEEKKNEKWNTSIKRPNHLLGVADEASIKACAPLGVDTFDSCFATRAGRHGTVFTSQGIKKVRQRKYADNYDPIDPECECETCQNYSIGFLHHALRAHEPIAGSLMSIHNLSYMNKMTEKLRKDILAGFI
eukprot:g245.t1